MIVAPHVGGSTLRVHLSNRFGLLPVTLGPATVGVRDSGAALVPGSERSVTFAGQAAVTIPAGGDVVSDPVALSFAAFQDLAVSVDVPGAVVDPTEHFITRQTSYLSPVLSGDHTQDGSGASFQQTTTGAFSTGWYFFDGIDVRAPGNVGAVVAFGDSITDGYQASLSAVEQLATINTNGRYPDGLARRLISAQLPLSVLDAGIGSNLVLTSGSVNGPSGLVRFASDALGQSGVTDVIVLEGLNDISAGATSTQLIDGYENLIAQAHAAGVSIQLGTLTPTGGSTFPGFVNPNANVVRNQVNQWIRTQQLSDGVIDFDAAVRDPSNPSQISAGDDGGDHLHLSPAGYQALANAVNLGSLKRPGCTTAAPVTHVSVRRLGPAAKRLPSFGVSWSASDPGGPGVASFMVQVQRRGRHPDPWRTLPGFGATTRKSARFTGQRATAYRFRVRATDTSGVAGSWVITPSVAGRSG
jgi:lysophospholipase L1-like esterase